MNKVYCLLNILELLLENLREIVKDISLTSPDMLKEFRQTIEEFAKMQMS